MNTQTTDFQAWTPQQSPRGIVQIIPNNNYDAHKKFACFLAANGYIVVCAPDIPPIMKQQSQLPIFLIRHDDGRTPWPDTSMYKACIAIKKRKEYRNMIVKLWDYFVDNPYECARPDKPCLIISNGKDVFNVASCVSQSLYRNYKDYNINHLTVVVYPYANNDMMQDENWPNAQNEILRFVNQMRTI